MGLAVRSLGLAWPHCASASGKKRSALGRAMAEDGEPNIGEFLRNPLFA